MIRWKCRIFANGYRNWQKTSILSFQNTKYNNYIKTKMLWK